ncbi:MAG: arylamine N-acetyltransferase [Microlunatus sp.]|nr:arylamine N-acetyltransferase [Microlunatus sp.]
MPVLGDDVRSAYLARLGVPAEPPSVEGLRLLVQRHAERVPYETLWIQAGESWTIDPFEAAIRIALHRRGGYCYHMNGALGLLLSSLGYTVRGHVGGVHGADGPGPETTGNHLVLTVEQLPDDSNPAGVWYVDNGLGDALHDPLPLVAGCYRQAPFQLSLEQLDGNGTWHLTHDPNGGFAGMGWTMADARAEDFEARHRWLSTSPESGFVRVAMAERRDSSGVDVIRGLVLSRIGAGAHTYPAVTRRTEWFDLLADRFDLRLDAMPPDARDRLWTTVLAAHHRWEESQAVNA